MTANKQDVTYMTFDQWHHLVQDTLWRSNKSDLRSAWEAALALSQQAEPVKCVQCDGKGSYYGHPCDQCHGIGKVSAPPSADAIRRQAREQALAALDDSNSLLVAILHEKRPNDEIEEQIVANREAYNALVALPAQEPVARVVASGNLSINFIQPLQTLPLGTLLYAAPPSADAIRRQERAEDSASIAMRKVAEEHAHGLALDLECILADDYSGKWYDSALARLAAYREAMNAIHERESPTFMGEPAIRALAGKKARGSGMSNCTTCEWAEWARTPTGRIKRSHHGKCNAPMPDIKTLPIPASIVVGKPRRVVIWADIKVECPTWSCLTATQTEE